MLQIVFTEDHHGPLGAQAPVQQRLADAARAGQRLGVADGAPVAFAAIGVFDALGHEGALGRGLRPMHQLVGQALGAGRQRLLGFHIAHALRAFGKHGAGHAEMKRAVSRLMRLALRMRSVETGGGGGFTHVVSLGS